MLTKFYDKKKILCASTVYNCNSVIIENEKKKLKKNVPNCLFNYSQNMRGTDYMDQQIYFYRFPHKSKKWWRRIFYHIFEISIHNSYLIWQRMNPEYNYSYLEYKKILSKELLNNGKKIEIEQEKIIVKNFSITFQGKEYYKKAELEKAYLHDIIKTELRGKCVYCGKSKICTRCTQCDIALCQTHFGAYHRNLLNSRI